MKLLSNLTAEEASTLTIALFSVAAVILVIVTIVLVFIWRSRDKIYEDDMAFIETCIRKWDVDYQSYKTIEGLFDDIWRNNYNPERTSKAYARFVRRYKKFTTHYNAKELINQN